MPSSIFSTLTRRCLRWKPLRHGSEKAHSPGCRGFYGALGSVFYFGLLVKWSLGALIISFRYRCSYSSLGWASTGRRYSNNARKNPKWKRGFVVVSVTEVIIFKQWGPRMAHILPIITSNSNLVYLRGHSRTSSRRSVNNISRLNLSAPYTCHMRSTLRSHEITFSKSWGLPYLQKCY